MFLAGDAAHTLPPTRGGYGANTGIDDVHNLAWKLQLVLEGRASPALLETYSAERQPIGWLRHQQTFARPDYAKHATKVVDVPLIEEQAMELGQLLRSEAVLGASEELPPAKRPDEWKDQPGVRAPHVWLDEAAKRSTIDAFGSNFCVASADASWAGVAESVSRKLKVPIEFVLSLSACDAFGLSSTDASLVRPDGVVGWRASPGEMKPNEREEALAGAVVKIGHLLP